MKAVLPAAARPLLEPHLPSDLDVEWFATPSEANAAIADADIAWVDMQPTHLVADAIRAAGPQLNGCRPSMRDSTPSRLHGCTTGA